MKKAVDYVSHYQLKSACKYAICIGPSKVTEMIFAVLEDWYHHIVLTHGFKLVSFLTYIIIIIIIAVESDVSVRVCCSFVTLDSACNSKVTTGNIIRLFIEEKVDAFVGPPCSSGP